MSALTDEIRAIREERDRLARRVVELDVYRRFVEGEGVERLKVEHASLRARVTEYLAAKDSHAKTVKIAHEEVAAHRGDMNAIRFRLDESQGQLRDAEAAVRAEVSRG